MLSYFSLLLTLNSHEAFVLIEAKLLHNFFLYFYSLSTAMKHLIIKRTDIPYSIININIINNNNNNITTSNSSSFNHISGLFPSRHQYCHHLQKDDYLGFLFTSFGEIPGLFGKGVNLYIYKVCLWAMLQGGQTS